MKQTSKKKVGIKDIAVMAGVSIGTVDRVLHNRRGVEDETKERVLAIVNELDYTPNILAKSLASKKIIRIAIVIPGSSDNNPYWDKPVKGINRAINELLIYKTKIIYEYFNASDELSFKDVLKKVCGIKPDGIIFNPVFRSISLDYIKEFENLNIPYVFIDINLKEANPLAYFGQDAEQSGLVAGRLMDLSTREDAAYLIVKLASNNIFSSHIEKRIAGFTAYFEKLSDIRMVNIRHVEIDLLNPLELGQSLSKILNNRAHIDGMFVPNSRGFILANFLEENNHKGYITIGYDLVEQNVVHLKKGNITYLICQKPEEQAYKAIMTLFSYIMSKKEVIKTTYSPIDIITKENIDFYSETN